MLWTAVFLILAFGWDLGWYAAGVRPLFPWQLKKLMAEAPEGLCLMDVRTRAEYRLFHLPGAIHRPDLIVRQRPMDNAHHHKTVVVVCMTGHRSPVVALRLQKKGERQVYNLTWGMLGWKLAGGNTVSGDPPDE